MNTHFEIGLFVSFTPQISFDYMYIENHQIWTQNDKKPCSFHGALKKPKHPNFGYYTIPDQPHH